MIKKGLLTYIAFLLTACSTANTQLVYISKENLELVCTISRIDTIKLPNAPQKLSYKKTIEQEELDIIIADYIKELKKTINLNESQIERLKIELRSCKNVVIK